MIAPAMASNRQKARCAVVNHDPHFAEQREIRRRSLGILRARHELCGIASNPGDMPLGADARAVALRKGYLDAARDLGGVMIRRDFRWAVSHFGI